MPVQETEKKSAEILPAEDIQKSQKLLPFLNAKAEFHQNRIDTIDEKIAVKQDKIARNEAKIEKLTAKADRLEDTCRMLKSTLGNFPFVQKLIVANEEKIKNIRENKIPQRQEKIKSHKEKIKSLTSKRDGISHKLNRVVALNDTIKSFSIGLNKERREVFANAMDRLNQATVDCLSDKKTALVMQKNELAKTYSLPDTSTIDKLNLQGKIKAVNEKISGLDDKMMKLAVPENHFAQKNENQLDSAIKSTAEKISDMAENATFGMSELAENAVIAAQSAKESPIKNVEMQVEDDFNMIDGIINNGSKEDLQKARTDLVSSIETAQQLAENPFIRQEIRDLAVQDIENLQKSLDKIENAMQLSETAETEYSDDWLNKMVLDGKAEIDDKGGFRINTDFYQKLDYADRHIEPMTENQAMTVMQALTLAGVEFSAVSRGDDKVALTVSEKDVSKLSDIMKTSVGKTVHRTAARSEPPEKYQTINPDYYAALAKNQRSTQIESHDVANAVMDSLTKADVLYSAVVRKNGTTAITVAKENADSYKKIADTVKSERAVQTVKKTERPPQKRQQTAGKTAYFSRKQLKNEVQRINGQGKKNQKSKENHLDK
jgi:hypothetical protein